MIFKIVQLIYYYHRRNITYEINEFFFKKKKNFGNIRQKYSPEIIHIRQIMHKCDMYGIFLLNNFAEFFIYI